MEPDAKASDYKDLLAEAMAFAGFAGDSKIRIDLNDLIAKRPPPAECQVEFLAKRVRLASLLFMSDNPETQALRKMMAACRMLTPMTVLETLVASTKAGNQTEEIAKDNINILIGTAVEIVIAITTVYKLQAEHKETGKCNCEKVVSDVEWWSGKFGEGGI